MRRRLELLSFGALVAHAVMAQPQWRAAVPRVERSGLHAIVLAPELIGVSRTDLGDLRLMDSLGHIVPFVLQRSSAGPLGPHFVPYTVLRNEVLPKSTVVELERPADRQLDDLHIWIRPVDVEKHVRITGSDDGERWYMVKDDHVVTQGARGDPPHQVLLVDLPRSDYRFFRITLNDSLTDPMQILGVGHFTEEAVPARYTSAIITWEQRDSASTTRLRITSAHPVPVERIVYTVRDTAPFHRAGRLQAPRTEIRRHGRKERTEHSEETIASFTLTSEDHFALELPGTREDTFDLTIDNGDDRPLHFSAVQVFNTERTLLANLEPGMRYSLTSGDAALSPPDFDMAHFADDLPAPVDTLSTGPLELLPQKAKAAPLFDPSHWWIWAIIIALMAGMGLMAVRMLRKEA
ncbi:MAG TPA: DUF3999 family protein [Flavobacteriales bacterium]|nr:DUF3999 family protein [Flavobacteriales bacterium]